MNASELVLILGEYLHRILHEHFSIDLIHDHHSRIVDGIFFRMSLLPKKLIVDFILMVFVVVIDVLS